MNYFKNLIVCFLFLIFSINTLFAKEENFLLIDGVTNEIMVEFGPSLNERMSPCSTFKVALSLMGYDSGLLVDENTPIWHFQEGYDDWLESRRTSSLLCLG